MSVDKTTKRPTSKLYTFLTTYNEENYSNIIRMVSQIKLKMHYTKMTGIFIRVYKILQIEKISFTNMMAP